MRQLTVLLLLLPLLLFAACGGARADQKKSAPAQDVSGARARFKGVHLSELESGFTAYVARVEMTLDQKEAARGRRALAIEASDALAVLAADPGAFFARNKSTLPFKAGGGQVVCSAESSDVKKMPWLLSGNPDDWREPLYIPSLLIRNFKAVLRSGSREMAWNMKQLKGSNLAFPSKYAEQPAASWLAVLEGSPDTVFKGELKPDSRQSGVTCLDFSLVKLPAAAVAALAPAGSSLDCSGGDITLEGALRFSGDKLLPGTLHIKADHLTVKGGAGSVGGEKSGAQVSGLAMDDASFDLTIAVDDVPPYVHFTEALEGEGSGMKTGPVQMTLDLRHKK